MKTQNTLRETDLLDWLRNAGSKFPPVTITVEKPPPSRLAESLAIDAYVVASWRKRRFRFVAELRSLSTPKALDDAVARVERYAQQLRCYPLVVTPYLSDEQLKDLEARQVSGLDLCGNGVLQVPGELLVFRSGAPNKHPRSTPIRNVYRGESSLVARAFLLRGQYDSTQRLFEEIGKRAGSVTLSTVSKVCSALAEDLIIDRLRDQRATRLRLLQPDKLLDSLAANYKPPTIRSRIAGSCSLNERELMTRLTSWSRQEGQRVVRTGSASTDCYATLGRERLTKLYCSKISGVIKSLGPAVIETDRFPDLELLETSDSVVYFDARDDLVASPVQCYLELQAGDKREQDAAAQVRQALLEGRFS